MSNTFCNLQCFISWLTNAKYTYFNCSYVSFIYQFFWGSTQLTISTIALALVSEQDDIKLSFFHLVLSKTFFGIEAGIAWIIFIQSIISNIELLVKILNDRSYLKLLSLKYALKLSVSFFWLHRFWIVTAKGFWKHWSSNNNKIHRGKEWTIYDWEIIAKMSTDFRANIKPLTSAKLDRLSVAHR